MPAWDLKCGPTLTDQIAAKDREAGATLMKMQAEAVLCEDLFGAFLLLIILNPVLQVTLINRCSTGCRILILVALGIGAVHRIVASVGRENRLYKIYVSKE